MMQLTYLRQKAHEMNAEIYALYLSARHPEVRWYVPLLLAVVIGYAISPIDFIPDLVPVFGFIDDVVLVALGIHAAYQLVSKNILGQARLQAYEVLSQENESAMKAYQIVGYAWVLAAAVMAILVYKLLFMTVI
ncbi:YkvA family protein [uncultured Pontibacter sp.]|uniref:YkvA family protein n=1 Tax=uncultured Pontibacter sp. TaxID=453356 RepID=UPI00262E410D|nr:YkvA family protein [uncultured Pontibacter sp.]